MAEIDPIPTKPLTLWQKGYRVGVAHGIWIGILIGLMVGVLLLEFYFKV